MELKNFGKLPSQPSRLIRLALKDLAKVRRHKNFIIDMNTWFSKQDDGKCHVCLAGAVMVGSLGYKPDDVPECGYFVTEQIGANDIALQAIDCFRSGCVSLGLALLGFDRDLPVREIYPFSRNPKLFMMDMRKLADDLEEVGL